MTLPHSDPMQPVPQLAAHARTLALPRLRTTVHCFEAGPPDRPTIVLIHGLQDEADTWRHVFGPLAERHRVIALDLPGFGRSDKARRRYGVPFYADVVRALMDARGITHATLIGNSLGAMIAEVIALTDAPRVSRLVLVAGTIDIVERPAGAAATPLDWLLLPWRDRRYFEGLRRSPQAAYDSLRPYYADLDALPQADRDFLYRRVNERVWDEPQRQAALAIQLSLPLFVVWRARRLARRIPGSPVPTTIVWGDADRIMPIGNGTARAGKQRAARFVRIAGAGHLPHQEQPQAFLAALGV